MTHRNCRSAFLQRRGGTCIFVTLPHCPPTKRVKHRKHREVSRRKRNVARLFANEVQRGGSAGGPNAGACRQRKFQTAFKNVVP